MAIEKAMGSISQQRTNQARVTGMPSGLYDLDQVIDGLQPGNLYVVAGRPGMGKTNFILSVLAAAAVKQNKSVALYSTTTDSSALPLRLLAQIATVPIRALRTGELDELQWDELQMAARSLSEAALQVTESSEVQSLRLQQCAKSAFKQHHRLDLFVVDGLQRFSTMLSNPEFWHEKTLHPKDQVTVDIEALLQELKVMAVEFDCPVVMTWQLGPEIDQRMSKRPTIADLHMTEIMEDAVDSVMLLFREDVYRVDEEWDAMAELIIARNRNGATGSVRLAYEGQYCRMRTMSSA